MKSQKILWLWVALLIAPPASAVEVTFNFVLALQRLSCAELPRCALTPPDPASIILTLDLADPRQDQPFSEADATFATFAAPFPTTSFFNTTSNDSVTGMSIYEATGLYTYDNLTGVATAALSDYFYEERFDGGFERSASNIRPDHWMYDDLTSSRRYEGGTAGLPAAATALAGPPVPLPPAILLLASGLFGLMFKRGSS